MRLAWYSFTETNFYGCAMNQINTGAGGCMEGEIIEAFEYEGRKILLCLKEDKNEPEWLTL
jgi:hypothetical protein